MEGLPKRGEIVWHGNKAYAICEDCGGLICVNKTLLGSLHFCA